MFLIFVIDLAVMESKKNSILTVVHKASRVVHLIPFRKSITIGETTKLFWYHRVELHGVPSVLYSDRGS